MITSEKFNIDELRKRYARQVDNPYLCKLGGWRASNDDSVHDDNTYKTRLETTAEAIHIKTEEVLADCCLWPALGVLYGDVKKLPPED